jgi:hypothetical protein
MRHVGRLVTKQPDALDHQVYRDQYGVEHKLGGPIRLPIQFLKGAPSPTLVSY